MGKKKKTITSNKELSYQHAATSKYIHKRTRKKKHVVIYLTMWLSVFVPGIAVWTDPSGCKLYFTPFWAKPGKEAFLGFSRFRESQNQ
jgi:hypothetical protein